MSFRIPLLTNRMTAQEITSRWYRFNNAITLIIRNNNYCEHNYFKNEQLLQSYFMQNRISNIQASNKAGSVRYNSCGWYLKFLGTWLDEKMHERLKSLDLSISQYIIIMRLLENDGLTQVEIGHEAMLPAYATSRNLDKLKSY